MKYKIILKTSSRHRERISNCLNTWLKGSDYIFLTDNILGDIGPEFSGSNRTDYSSNEEKTVNFINHCIKHKEYSDYDWFIFIDDDAILNKNAIDFVLPYFDKSFVYGLRMGGAWPKDTSLDFPSGGSGYFISPQLIQSLPLMVNRGHGQEDVSMGEWLRDNKISLRDYFSIDNKKVRLKLNGWYPFSEIKEKHNLSGGCEVIEFIDKKHEIFLKKHIVHHYIRHECLMRHILLLYSQSNYSDYLEYLS